MTFNSPFEHLTGPMGSGKSYVVEQEIIGSSEKYLVATQLTALSEQYEENLTEEGVVSKAFSMKSSPSGVAKNYNRHASAGNIRVSAVNQTVAFVTCH